ncbi:hypothetical protein L195_g003244 [Trifolium pratense]|uniref:Uncharacterized protein n=1 Tax=Trifolium pratense TaxID=57577 RepID=A0A2K3NUQ4_TRIPR|nr:hypothetical protein L195_g003244 [Trifolium pratense]
MNEGNFNILHKKCIISAIVTTNGATAATLECDAMLYAPPRLTRGLPLPCFKTNSG